MHQPPVPRRYRGGRLVNMVRLILRRRQKVGVTGADNGSIVRPTTKGSMHRRDWLIVMLGLRGTGSSPAMDPVRVQKAMFLLAEEAGLPATDVYAFEPYNYGPYSFVVRDDLEALVSEGLASKSPVPGYSWCRFPLTDAGLEAARSIVRNADHEPLQHAADIKRTVTGLSFNRLLKQVYA